MAAVTTGQWRQLGMRSDKSQSPAGIVSGKLRERLKGLQYLGSKWKANDNLGRLLAGSRAWISRQ